MGKVFVMFGTLLIFVVLFGMAYVRVSPLNEAKWHTPVSATENADLTGGAVRVMDGDDETLAAFDKAILRLCAVWWAGARDVRRSAAGCIQEVWLRV